MRIGVSVSRSHHLRDVLNLVEDIIMATTVVSPRYQELISRVDFESLTVGRVVLWWERLGKGVTRPEFAVRSEWC